MPMLPTPSEPHVAGPLTIRRQREDDNPSDFAAVMANRAWLRRWSGSAWPEDDFTADANLADLREHIAEHTAGLALGYSIETAGEVVGSLYVQPLEELLAAYAAPAEVRARLAGAAVRADCWTRLDRDEGLLARAVAAIDPWLRATWPGLVWAARADCAELEAAYHAAGLALAADLAHPESGRRHRLFA